ncbi:unnamed protein product [Mortierella alpina]
MSSGNAKHAKSQWLTNKIAEKEVIRQFAKLPITMARFCQYITICEPTVKISSKGKFISMNPYTNTCVTAAALQTSSRHVLHSRQMFQGGAANYDPFPPWRPLI